MTSPARRILLCADDYALTRNISLAVAELARQGRLSAASALVTTPEWRCSAQVMVSLRRDIALGLHLNLTLGAPLGPMPDQTTSGVLPPVSAWIRQSLTNRLQPDEVEAEFDRQFDAFEAIAGAPPDHVDGHHHVHVLPGIRGALARVLARRFERDRMPLVRVPGDKLLAILGRGANVGKSLTLAVLSAGSGALFKSLGATVNEGFAGFSSFRRSIPFADELDLFNRNPGPAHMVMCHPGHTDEVLARLDPVTLRREDEFLALIADQTLPARIHHPAYHRNSDGYIDWKSLLGT